jgi:hypothetical protein
MSEEETYDIFDKIKAIEEFLEYGEKTYEVGHKGYFSGGGWAATVLRYHLKELEEEARRGYERA